MPPPNWLRAFEAAARHLSFTAAARELHVTPSAVSHALRGLREELEDPLLVRSGAGMVPTPRAEALRLPLHRALNALEAALSGGVDFDPARSTRTFTLRMPDSFAPMVVPALLERVRSEAPGVDLDVRPARPGLEELASGDADLAFRVGRVTGAGLRSRFLMEGHLLCVVRADHPEVGPVLDLDTYCRLPHVLISPTGTGVGTVDEALERIGRRRRVHLRIRYFLAAPLVVARSDMVLTGPGDLMRTFAELAPLRVLEPPVALPAYRASLVWHERLHEDPAHRWMRRAIVRAMAR